MKRILTHPILLLLALAAASCEKDNYAAPDAAVYGSLLDFETGEPVAQDIYSGTEIEYVESGYTTIEKMIVRNDGTYRNMLIFSGDYEITPRRGNFEPLEPQRVHIEGITRLDFQVKPYIRLKNVVIFRNGDQVKASFLVEQTGYDKVQTVALFAYREPSVGYRMYDDQVEVPVGERLRTPTPFTVTLDIPSSKLKRGTSYFFRAGALIDVPEAKYNYGPTVRLNL